MLVNDFQSSSGVALENLCGAAEGDVDADALAAGEAARHVEMEGVGSDGEIVAQELHVDRIELCADGRAWTEEFARAADEHQAGRFAAAGVGREDCRQGRIELVELGF